MKFPRLLLSLACPKGSFLLHPFSSTASPFRSTLLCAMSTSTSQHNTASSQLLVSLSDRLARTDDDDNRAAFDSNRPKPLGRLVLASQSPRRREILDMMGLSNCYEVEPSPLDESQLQADLVQRQLSSKEYTLRLAEAKAQALAQAHTVDKKKTTKTTNENNDDAAADIPIFYLGSDTIVELDEKILEKPKDKADAKRMLTIMSGRQHHVHTGVALYRLYQQDIQLVGSFTDTATVTFCTLGENDIDAYIASGEPMDKAGSYGIQGIGGQFVTAIEGDFFTVMGMPMHQTSRIVAMALLQESQV
ncbi:Maf-like septum formation family protein [Nitzschia inconspicua]|uniref:Maf-like septum formation family protein n=1 Tax=Nitzschia inconspicua TaxID=303405 RepID=A0A9K3Q4Y5_9STRA|nr:Maf-like septum formation family protein [Nitzschia inconspicua]